MASLDPVFGDTAVLDRARDHEVKGTLLGARRRYVLERWGQAALDDVVSRLSEPDRGPVLSPVLPFAWYPMRTLMEIDRAIVLGPMKGDVREMKHFGSTIARYDLPTVYKMLFKFGTPAFVIKRVSIPYGQYFKGGTMRGESRAPNTAAVTMEGVFPEYLCKWGVSGWFTAAIELSGGQDVEVTEVDCIHQGRAACRWEARWK